MGIQHDHTEVEEFDSRSVQGVFVKGPFINHVDFLGEGTAPKEIVLIFLAKMVMSLAEEDLS